MPVQRSHLIIFRKCLKAEALRRGRHDAHPAPMPRSSRRRPVLRDPDRAPFAGQASDTGHLRNGGTAQKPQSVSVSSTRTRIAARVS